MPISVVQQLNLISSSNHLEPSRVRPIFRFVHLTTAELLALLLLQNVLLSPPLAQGAISIRPRIRVLHEAPRLASSAAGTTLVDVHAGLLHLFSILREIDNRTYHRGVTRTRRSSRIVSLGTCRRSEMHHPVLAHESPRFFTSAPMPAILG